MINKEITDARDSFSSEDLEASYMLEMEELELEFENEILPDIYSDIYPDDCIEKLTLLGDLYARNPRIKESALYLRYYYYMIAKYVLEKKQEAPKSDIDLQILSTFDDDYKVAKIQYQRIRDNTLPLSVKLIRDFVDASENRISIIDDKELEISFYADDKEKNTCPGANLFFFPEADFYGTIDSILVKFSTALNIGENYYFDEKRINTVLIKNDTIEFVRYNNDDAEILLEGNIEGLDITVSGHVNQEYNNSGTKETTSAIEEPSEKLEENQSGSDIFETWDVFKNCLNRNVVKWEHVWMLICLFYLKYRHNDNTIPVHRLKLLYKDSHRVTEKNLENQRDVIRKCARLGYVDNDNPYISLTEQGEKLVIEKYLTLSESDIKTYEANHRLNLEKNSVKICSHPTYKTWKDFLGLIKPSIRITVKEWYLLYLYYLIQKYNIETITIHEIRMLRADDNRFSTKKNMTTPRYITLCLSENWITQNTNGLSLTEKGKKHIRSLICTEV